MQKHLEQIEALNKSTRRVFASATASELIQNTAWSRNPRACLILVTAGQVALGDVVHWPRSRRCSAKGSPRRGVSVDGNDNVWITNLATSAYGIVELCGFGTGHCPPGAKTGDAISLVGGYVGGGLQMQVDVGVGRAGDVWVTNNWQYYPAALGRVLEALSTLGAGQGLVVFYGMAKPVKCPDRAVAPTVSDQ